MARVFLLNPLSAVLSGFKLPVQYIMNTLPSLGICSLGAKVRQDKHTVALLDAAALGYSEEMCLDHILAWRPDVLGISTYTSNMAQVHSLLVRLKMKHKDLVVILGGPHVSALRENLKNPDDLYDFVVLGEGEQTLSELLACLENGRDCAAVPGLMMWSHQAWKRTADRSPLSDLDQLPLPAWDLLPGFPGAYHPPIFSYTSGPSAPVMTSRGCPYQCGFCDHSVFGYQYRSFSTSRILDMISHLTRDFGVRHILFVDDHLSLNRKRLRSLCQQLIDSDLRINWTADVRADSLEVEDLYLMKKAGCVRINCGLETGSPDLLTAMNKKLDLDKARQTLKVARILDIQTKGLFILGYPGENPQTIKATLDFITTAELTEMNLSKFAPYPGTDHYEDFRAGRREHDFWDQLDGLHFCEPDPQRNEWLENQYSRIIKTFYHRPGIILSYLKLILHQPESRQRLTAFLLGFLKHTLQSRMTSLLRRGNG